MTNAQIAAKFRRAYKGQNNFMTPKVLEYGEAGDFLYEISEGRGIVSDMLYGVTVLTAQGEKSSLSTCFDTFGHAKGFAEDLAECAA